MAAARPPRAFISYAHDSDQHVERVRALYELLRANGVDARWDLPAAEERRNWVDWMEEELRQADFILVVASPEYGRRARGATGPSVGRGVQWESRRIAEFYYRNQRDHLRRILPVVLPGCSTDGLPDWMNVTSSTVYEVKRFDLAGIERLLRTLTDQPYETEAPLRPRPHLPPRGRGRSAAPTPSSASLAAGQRHLENKRYEEARKAFIAAVGEGPDDPDAHYYLALSLLAGSHVSFLPPERIAKVESSLQQASQAAPTASHVWALWAVLKEEYFISAGRGDGQPRVAVLLASATGIDGRHRAELVTHVHAPGSAYWRTLRNVQSGGKP